MRKLIVTEFVSLDGVMEAPGGEPAPAHRLGGVFPVPGSSSSSSRRHWPRRPSCSAASPTRFRGRLAEARGRLRRQDERDAEVRRLHDAP